MKRLIPIIALLAAFYSFAGAQDIRAVTEGGRSVLLHNDGTWSYVEAPQASISPARTFKVPDTAIGKVSSRKVSMSVFYDPNLWVVEKLTDEIAEFRFQLGDSEVYAYLMAEAGTFGLSAVRSGIIANAKKAAESFEVTEEGSAIVNGVQVQTLKARASMQGIDVTFYLYYWSGPKGRVQLCGYASSADFDANFKAILDLMNGLTL